MKCLRCGSQNVNVQIINDKIKTNNVGILRLLEGLSLICVHLLWILTANKKLEIFHKISRHFN